MLLLFKEVSGNLAELTCSQLVDNSFALLNRLFYLWQITIISLSFKSFASYFIYFLTVHLPKSSNSKISSGSGSEYSVLFPVLDAMLEFLQQT